MNIIEQICEKIYDDCSFFGETPSHIESYEDLHDIIYLNGYYNINLGGTVYMMNEQGEIYNMKYKEIKKAINDFIDEEFVSYYGDIAFSSRQDYNSYRN